MGVPAGGTEEAVCTPTCETGESRLSLGKGEWNPRGPCGPAVPLCGIPLRECLHQCPREVLKNSRGDPRLVAWTGIVCGHDTTYSKAVTSAGRRVSGGGGRRSVRDIGALLRSHSDRWHSAAP